MRIGVFATHPIQYQVPLWRALSAEKNIDRVINEVLSCMHPHVLSKL